MELHPTSESWRTALWTATGASAIGVAALVAAFVADGLLALWIMVGVAALATLLPAIGTMTARVDADRRGITVTRFGAAKHFAWTEVRAVSVIERRAQVPDGTEYHWTGVSARKHVVAVPTLELANGEHVQLSALASPAAAAVRPADEHAAALEALRSTELQPA
jgi:hypothetical protein